MTILVVEDEPAIAQLLRYTLSAAGYLVDIAEDAAQARTAAANKLPGLAIIDWMMPGESGISLARAWRAEARTKTSGLPPRARKLTKFKGLILVLTIM
jgi:two-component system, OmpR family, phosphate regulon response regulator PhoB